MKINRGYCNLIYSFQNHRNYYMANKINNALFKKTIIVFWAIWWLIILWTDSVSAAAHLGVLNASWAPDKYTYFASTLNMYHVPAWFPAFLYVCILIWAFFTVITFMWACFSLNKNKTVWLYRANIAFIISLVFWFAFLIADQIIMRYDIEQIHIVQGGFQLLSFLSLYLLPD